MAKELYIFVDSERPDAYLNSVVHSVLSLDVRKVAFLHIRGASEIYGSSESAPPSGAAARTLGRVQSLIGRLAEKAEYEYFSGEQEGSRVSLGNEYGHEEASRVQAYYRRCTELPVSYSSEELAYDDLLPRIRQIATSGGNAFVDATAVRKRYMGDLVAACLIEGIRGLFVFDILVRQEFAKPWRMLVHRLSADSSPKFSYQNVLART